MRYEEEISRVSGDDGSYALVHHRPKARGSIYSMDVPVTPKIGRV